MLDQAVIEWATLIGTALSVIGVGIAIAQIRKTQRTATAAAEAALAAQRAISGNVMLSDITSCIRLMGEVQAHVRGSRWESALLRVADTRASLIELRSIAATPELRATLQRTITQLAVLSDLFEEADADSPEIVDRVAVMRTLADASHALTEWLGPAKYRTEGTEDDS